MIDIDYKLLIKNYHSQKKTVDEFLKKIQDYQTKVQTEAYNKWLKQNFPK